MSTSNRENPLDAAAQFNGRVLRRLQKALERQPDLDLTTVLSPRYQTTLASKKECNVPGAMHARPECQTNHATPNPPPDPLRRPLWTIDETSPAIVVHQLSSTVQSVLTAKDQRWQENGQLLSLTMSRVLESATFLFQSALDRNHFVARFGENLVVKAISDPDSTEYTMLQFLETGSLMPLAPKPHGVISIGQTWYMFMSLVPGVNLETVWSRLTDSQKTRLSHDLNTLLLQLREVPVEDGRALGGVAGQGCKDTRRHTRIADLPIYTSQQLWEFMYGCARNKDTVYGHFLRKQTFPHQNRRIVLTHGDVRSANVMVRCHDDGHVQITGLIDWEMSGFYPEDFECIKAMNNLSPIGKDDWYLYLPECISPRHYVESWHADFLWDGYVV